MVMERQEKGMGKQAANPAAFNIAEAGFGDRPDLDDDGRDKRTGTLVTASAHIITAVIGSGVLSLAWAISQLGWVIGPAVLVSFSVITWFCSNLLADCYRSPDPVHGKRNYTYGDAVRANLGVAKYRLCSLAQYVNLVGITIGYAITTAINMGAIKRSNCFHHNGHDAKCEASSTTNMIIFASIQIMLSQLPNFHKIWWLSIVAAVMSLAYSTVGLGLSIATIAGTLVTASAHIITAVIGSGVLSLAWAISQLGWVIGPAVLVAFSVITWFCSSLLADCYRSPDPVHGKRNYTYGDAVRANLGVAMSQSNKLLLCHLPLLLLASAAAAEAHHRISGNQCRWPRYVPELAHTMNVQPLGTTVHAAQGGTVDVDGGLIANTYKARHGVARSAGHNGMIDVPAVPVGPGVESRPYDWKEHAVLVVCYGVARPAESRGMIRVLAVPEGLEAESHAYDRPDHAVLLMRYGLALSVGRSGMNVVSVLEVTEEEGPFAYHREHAVHLTRDGTQRSAGLNGRMAMSLPAGSEAESFAYRREHDDRRKRSTYEQADTGLASVPLVWIGQIPRPTIRAVQGAAADVAVKNFSLTEHVAIHWHGIRQIGTPWADGTEGVAQCPIPPGDTFTYRFVVDHPGAYTRHAHHGVQRSPGHHLNGTTFVAVPACQAEPFASGRKHTDVHLAREDTRRTAGRDNGITAVLVPGRAEAETLACDCDHPVVPLDEWWNWHAQAAAGVAAVPSVLVGEPQLSLSYSVRACFNCSLLASEIRDATRPDCSSPAPFTVAAGKAYHIVTSSGLLFDWAVPVHLSTASLIALIMVVQVALDDQRRKNGGGRDAAAMALLILLLVITSLPNPAMAARPLHGGGGVHDQTAAGPVAAEPAGLMPESRVAAGSACTNDPNTQDPHRCVPH